MNFTYLLEGPSEPAQELLQQYEYYLAIVVLSEDMSTLVLDSAGFELKSSEHALCWLVQPKHLETAPKGGTLNRLHAFVKKENIYTNIDHSFLAFASRNDLIKGSGGCYVPLHLHSKENDAKRKEIIKRAIDAALSASKPKPSKLSVENILSAANLIAALVGLAK